MTDDRIVVDEVYGVEAWALDHIEPDGSVVMHQVALGGRPSSRSSVAPGRDYSDVIADMVQEMTGVDPRAHLVGRPLSRADIDKAIERLHTDECRPSMDVGAPIVHDGRTVGISLGGTPVRYFTEAEMRPPVTFTDPITGGVGRIRS